MAKRPTVLSVEPANYATDVGVSSSIQVEFDVDLDTRYIDGNFTLMTTNNEVIEGRTSYRKKVITFVPLEPLAKGTNFVFTIKGDGNLDDEVDDGIKSIIGATMAGSFISRFMTERTDMLPVPTIISPVNNTIIKKTPVFTWEAVEGATHYDVEISKSNTFSTKIFPAVDSIRITSPTLSPNVEMPDGIYYWRIRSVGGTTNKGAWSSVMQFNLTTEALGQIAAGDSAFVDATDDVSFTGTMELEQIETFPKELEIFVPTNVANLYFRMIGDINLADIDVDSLQLEGVHVSGDFDEESHGRVAGKISFVTAGDYTTYIIFTPDPLPIDEEEIPVDEEEIPVDEEIPTEEEVTE